MGNIRKIYFWIIISIICSIVSICFSLFRIAPFSISEATYIGIITTLMGVIFTIFVGYQVYNIIDIKKEIKDFSLQKNKLDELVVRLEGYQKVNESNNYRTRGMLALINCNYDISISLLLKSLETLLLGPHLILADHWSDIDILKINISNCFSNIGKIKDDDSYKSIVNIINSSRFSSLTVDLKDLLTKMKESYK